MPPHCEQHSYTLPFLRDLELTLVGLLSARCSSKVWRFVFACIKESNAGSLSIFLRKHSFLDVVLQSLSDLASELRRIEHAAGEASDSASDDEEIIPMDKNPADIQEYRQCYILLGNCLQHFKSIQYDKGIVVAKATPETGAKILDQAMRVVRYGADRDFASGQLLVSMDLVECLDKFNIAWTFCAYGSSMKTQAQLFVKHCLQTAIMLLAKNVGVKQGKPTALIESVKRLLDTYVFYAVRAEGTEMETWLNSVFSSIKAPSRETYWVAALLKTAIVRIQNTVPKLAQGQVFNKVFALLVNHFVGLEGPGKGTSVFTSDPKAKIFTCLLRISHEAGFTVSHVMLQRIIENTSNLPDIENSRLPCPGVEWGVILLCLQHDFDTFILSESTNLRERLFYQITASVITEPDELDKQAQVVQRLLVGFQTARDLHTFIDLWYQELCALDLTVTKDEPSVWVAVGLLRCISIAVSKSWTPRQTISRLTRYIQEILSKGPEDPSACFVLLDTILGGLKESEATKYPLQADIIEPISAVLQAYLKQKGSLNRYGLSLLLTLIRFDHSQVEKYEGFLKHADSTSLLELSYLVRCCLSRSETALRGIELINKGLTIADPFVGGDPTHPHESILNRKASHYVDNPGLFHSKGLHFFEVVLHTILNHLRILEYVCV